MLYIVCRLIQVYQNANFEFKFISEFVRSFFVGNLLNLEKMYNCKRIHIYVIFCRTFFNLNSQKTVITYLICSKLIKIWFYQNWIMKTKQFEVFLRLFILQNRKKKNGMTKWAIGSFICLCKAPRLPRDFNKPPVRLQVLIGKAKYDCLFDFYAFSRT